MLNRQIVMGLVVSSVSSGLSLAMALPGMAQQVVLTPGGTMFAPLQIVANPMNGAGSVGTVEAAAESAVTPAEGTPVSPSNPQASDYVGAYPPGTEVTDIPFINQATVVAYDDPRLPEAVRGIAYGKDLYWVTYTVTDTAGNSQAQVSLVQKGGGWDSVAPENLPNVIQKMQASKAFMDAQDFLNSPEGKLAQQQQLQMIVSNPEIYSFHPSTWGQPVKNVVDKDGKVLMSREQIIEQRRFAARYQLGEFPDIALNAEWTPFNEYETLGYVPEQVDTQPVSVDMNGNITAVRPDFKNAMPATIEQTAGFYRNLLRSQNGDILSPLSASAFSDQMIRPTSGEVLSVAQPNLMSGSMTTPLTALPASVGPVAGQRTPTIGASAFVQPLSTAQPSSQGTVSSPTFTLMRNPMPEALRLRAESPLSQSRIMPGLGN